MFGVGVGVGGGGVGVGVGLHPPPIASPVGPEDSPEEEVTPDKSGTCAGGWQFCANRSCAENTHVRIPSKRCFFIGFLS